MSEQSDSAALETVRAFIETFNAQDHVAQANTLNYPHVRLANGRFTRFESAAEFIERGPARSKALEDEGWHHTALQSAEVVHSGDDKVHLALTVDRCRADGTVYNRFETLWIATLQDGHWGIQFRSSYLR